ncbi:MAG: hypothetical protein OXQ27_13455 [Chloroflexota bacterium]|nr:hypothetical protein [Chloroflexota bacterium]MDE2931909.1 hypothetical protein [Chloroflexota bacterium]
MRPLSRFLSVFLALVLLATSFLVASAHTGDPTAKITIARVDTASDVHVGTKLKFLVIVERGGHDLLNTIVIRSVHRQDDDEAPTNAFDNDTFSAPGVNLGTASGVAAGTGAEGAFQATDPALTTANPVGTIAEFTYTVLSGELGSAKQRNIPVQFELVIIGGLDAGGDNPHAINADSTGDGDNDALVIKSNTVNVLVTKDPGTGDGASQVTLNVSMARPDEIAAGEKVKFTVSTETGKYGFGPKPLIISKQLYDDDGDKDGGMVAVAVFTLADLQSNSVSAEASKEYTLVQDDIDASKVEFSYALEIAAADLDGEPANYATDKTQKGTFNLAPPAPVATPSPYLYMTDAAKVEEIGGGTAIVVTRLDTMTTTTLTLGTLSGGGALLPRDSGYIRDESRGQTYAVVRRASDNMVVRVWISSNSEWVPHVPWANVIAFYNVPAAVLNAIPLDDSMPEVDQLVDVGGDYYVYRDRAWRHIPNLSTFRAEGFYWCDLTTAHSGHAAASSTATPLPSKVGPPTEGYPACRGM